MVHLLHSTLQKLEINWIIEWPLAPVLENVESLWEFFLKEISSSAGSEQCTKASTQGMARTPAAIRLFAEAMVQTLGLAERNAWDNFQTHTLPAWHCFPVLEFFPVAPRCSSEHQVHQPREKSFQKVAQVPKKLRDQMRRYGKNWWILIYQALWLLLLVCSPMNLWGEHLTNQWFIKPLHSIMRWQRPSREPQTEPGFLQMLHAWRLPMR